MVEEKVRFKLRVTRKRMVELVKNCFPGNLSNEEKLEIVSFETTRDKENGWLVFKDPFGELWKAFLTVCDEKIELTFTRVCCVFVDRIDFCRDRKKVFPDIEYLDLLGMLINKY